MLLVVILILTVLWIYLRVNASKIKGKIGENVISRKLKSLPKEYFLFDDVYLNIDGRSVQIDHVVISKYGVFIIETKNYKGWIFGGENSPFWTKSMYGRKYEFQNPLKQNYSHLKALQTLFDAPEYIFEPIVVFLDKARLKINHQQLVYASKLKKRILSRKDIVISEEQVSKYVSILSSENVIDKKYRKEHVSRVKDEVSFKADLIKSKICPRCHSALVERKGKNGKFLGCSNFPNCRFTSSL